MVSPFFYNNGIWTFILGFFFGIGGF
jgi:hypothetical protein